MCWTADYDDPSPRAHESSLARYMTLAPSMVRPISSNCRMSIPCRPTQKWYYISGTEDKDCEYGKVWIAVVAPLSNVTGASTAQLIVRCRWTFDFEMPEIPPDPSGGGAIIYASSPKYFTDSSSSFKDGKYLTFKWHEGGSITGFPNAEPWTIYKIMTGVVQYYDSGGKIQSTLYAVCHSATTEAGEPLLVPMKDLETAKAFAKDHTDAKLLPFNYQGPWVSPDNPPWQAIVALGDEPEIVLSRAGSSPLALETPTATYQVYDENAQAVLRLLSNSFKGLNKRDVKEAVEQLTKLTFLGTTGVDALVVAPVPVAASTAPGGSASSGASTTSSFEKVEDLPQVEEAEEA